MRPPSFLCFAIFVGCSPAPPSQPRAAPQEANERLVSETQPLPANVDGVPAGEIGDPPEPPESACAGLTASEEPPLRLVLQQPRINQLRAVICNTSSRPHRVLVSFMSQPLMLELEHPERGPVEAYDERSVRGGSGRILESMFRTVEPGGELVLEEADVELSENEDEDESTTHLRFGTLQFQSLLPATYRATLRMHARNARTVDAGRLEDVWLGRMVSESLYLNLQTRVE